MEEIEIKILDIKRKEVKARLDAIGARKVFDQRYTTYISITMMAQ